MIDLLNLLSYLITNYLLPLIFPGQGGLDSKSIYYWIFKNPLVLLFYLIPFIFIIVYLFRRLLKTI